MSDNYHKKWYKRNKEKRAAWIVARQKKLRDFVQELKLQKGCCICGYNKCAQALHFHHHIGEKEGTVSKWVAQGRAQSAVLKEIEKCICVCANCHAELHAEEPTIG